MIQPRKYQEPRGQAFRIEERTDRMYINMHVYVYIYIYRSHTQRNDEERVDNHVSEDGKNFGWKVGVF